MEYNQKLLEDALSKIDFVNTTPSKKDALKILNINKPRVVILGQDPYPTKGVANGRAFAVEANVDIPKSLKNIFKEIKETFGEVKTDRTLISWEKQGVMLLNTSLTTNIGESNSHQKIWNDFTLDLIKKIDKEDVIWVLWGKEAQKYKSIIKHAKHIIEDAHPSPLAQKYRKGDSFSKLDKIIKIEW